MNTKAICATIFISAIAGSAIGQGAALLVNYAPNPMQPGAYLYYEECWSAGQQKVGVLHDPRPSTYVQLPYYCGTDSALTVGDASRPEVSVNLPVAYNIFRRHAELSYTFGMPSGVTVTNTGSAQNGVYKSTKGGYWWCGTGATANSQCVLDLPYLGWGGGTGSSISGFVTTGVGNLETFFGLYGSPSEMLGFYRLDTAGASNWKGYTVKAGVVSQCDTGLLAIDGVRGLFVTAWNGSEVKFFAGYADTSPVYRCSLPISQVSDPSPSPGFRMWVKGTQGNKELSTSHFHFVWS